MTISESSRILETVVITEELPTARQLTQSFWSFGGGGENYPHPNQPRPSFAANFNMERTNSSFPLV